MANRVTRVLSRAGRELTLRREFKQQFETFSQLCEANAVQPPTWNDRYPCMHDATSETGFDHHYIYHPAWAARMLREHTPAKHVDVSSTLAFVATVSAWIPIDFYDFRPAPLQLSQVNALTGDLTNLNFPDDSVESLSCMHVVEHIGLGRYGDPMDPLGDVRAVKELKRVLKPGGQLLFVTPVGESKICFNAHRVYSFDQIVGFFAELELRDWALLPDDVSRGFVDRAPKELFDAQRYGCGCFRFVKPL